jgi:hypothetical protein
MELVDPPLPEDTKEKLITLVNIYTQELHFSNEENIITDPQVYTVHDLKEKSEVVLNDCVEEMDTVEDVMNGQVEVLSPMTQSHWTRYKGKTLFTSITKTNQLMVFGDIIAVCCENLMKHMNTLCGKDAQFFNAYIYHCDLKD